MWRIVEIRQRRDGARVVTVGIMESEYYGQHQILVLPDDDFESKVQEEMTSFYNSFSVQEWEVPPIKVGDTFEFDEQGRIRKITAPRDDELVDKPYLQIRPRDEEAELPPPPDHMYEFYTEEITHPKARGPIVLGREPLGAFVEELSPEEISALEVKVGKKIRKLPHRPSVENWLVRAEEVMRRNRSYLTSLANVVKVAIGRKLVKGKDVRRYCITVYVSKKLAEHELASDQVIPKEVEGIETDVIEMKSS